MASPDDDVLRAIETHDVAALAARLNTGLDPQAPIGDQTPIDWLLSMYTRTPRFTACLRLLLDHGGKLTEPILAAVLLDDAEALSTALGADPALRHRRFTLPSAFSPLAGATLLHIAAEFGHARAAQVLLECGAEVDARASGESPNSEGHTPLFHTVNTHEHFGLPLMNLLLAHGARTDVRVPVLTWGRSHPWETTCFDLTPISYAQLGLLPQMHRREPEVYATIAILLDAAQRPRPALANVPNRYLNPSSRR